MLIAHLVPLALGAAVSPALLAVVLEVLATQGPRARRSVLGYLVGAALPLILLGVVGLFLVPQLLQRRVTGAGRVVDAVDVVLGAFLILLAVGLTVRRPRKGAQGNQSRTGASRMIGLGVVMMLTNVSTIVLTLAGLREIALADVSSPPKAAALAFLVVVALTPIWLPLLVAVAAPRVMARVLGPASTLMRRHGRSIAVVVSVVSGGYLVGRGLRWW